jgi:16S rRNA processing protein RimM
MSDFDWAILARVVRPQGRHGEIVADLLTDFPERFADRKRLYLLASEATAEALREVVLERHWLHKARVVLKFSGVDSISDAEMLRGLLIAIPRNERVSLNDDSVYLSDLLGCTVVDVTSKPVDIGKIIDVYRDASLLVVQPKMNEELLIPFAKAYLVRIDLPAKRIEMRLPTGILDVNAPVTEEERRDLDNPDRSEET